MLKKNIEGTVPFYRYWSGRDHFYTININEIGTAVPGKKGKAGYTSEGIEGYCYPDKVEGSIPLYRYFGNGDHFYATDANEIGTTTPGKIGNSNY